jgi:hypothetical protein
LPDVAVEGALAVDLELMHVEVFAKELRNRLDHPRVASQFGERLVDQVAREDGAHGIRILLPNDLRPMLPIDAWYLVQQDPHFLRREEGGEEEVAVPVEVLQLLLGQFHFSCLLFSMPWRATPVMPSAPFPHPA